MAIEKTGDLSPVIDKVFEGKTPEQLAAIMDAAEKLTGKTPENAEEAAQILMESFSEHQEAPKIEAAFNQIELDALNATHAPEAQEAIDNALAAKLQTELAEITGEEIDQQLAEITTTDPVEYLGAAARRIGAMTRIVLDKLTAFINSGEMQLIKERFKAVAQFLEDHKAEIERLASGAQTFQELQPYLSEVLSEMSEEEQYKNMTLDDFLKDRIDENGNPLPPILNTVLMKAKQRQTGELLKVQYKQTTKVRTTTDKLANVFFSLAAPSPLEEINGQRQMITLKYEGGKSKKQISLMYDFVWDDNTLAKFGLADKFDAYDWFVMTTLDNLYAAGNDVVSFTKIYHEMGGKGSPGQKNLEDLYHSLIKGMGCILTIDDHEVLKAWGGKSSGKYHEIHSPAMPVIIANERFVANGNIAEGRVKITGLSPFMLVADPIGHVTAWDKEILTLYDGRKTRRYWAVMRHLMAQIAWMRTGKRSHKLTYSDLYKNTGSKSTREQQLDRAMLYRLLDEVFKPAQYVATYTESDKADPVPGVILTLHKKRLQLPEGKQPQ